MDMSVKYYFFGFSFQMHSLSDPLSALGQWSMCTYKRPVDLCINCCAGTGAFVSHDKIPRTPISKQNTRAEGTHNHTL